MKMHQGHRGANHPVKRWRTGRVEITSMNHGFAVDRDTLPANVRESHVSLFDGSNCGIELTDRPAFSVQYHPGASPGPQDSYVFFEKVCGWPEMKVTPGLAHIPLPLSLCCPSTITLCPIRAK
jgi:carbamoyl-phosphate synthase small subunit